MINENRRAFLKAVGLSSGSFLMDPFENLDIQKEKQIKTGGDVFKKRRIETDIVVVGGGMAGICAAVAAARSGEKVVLVQNRSRLGGNASSEIRMHISGASQLKAGWRETGILEEIMLDDAVHNLNNAYPMFDFILYNKVISESNITLLLDTALFDVVKKDDRISSVTAFCSPTEEIYEISAAHFADCTGDGTLGALAGAEYMRGREARSEWNESFGPDVPDDGGMGNSLLFMASEYDKPMPFVPPKWSRKYEFEDFRHRKIYSLEYGYWWLELAGEYDVINDGQQLRHELLAVLFGVWDYIKNSGNHPESENWALTWVGMIQGKRESRRITGDFVMTQHDVQVSKDFPDRVGYGGWPLDDHPTAGMDDLTIKPNRSIHLKAPYSIPLRCLYSKSVSNLWMAGRDISVSHAALSSTRVMATCSVLGQAIGVAMSYAKQNKLNGRQIVQASAHMKALQQLLLRRDQALLNVSNEDQKDLVRKAKVSASWEETDGPAVCVTDGINRQLPDGKPHFWKADMKRGDPSLILAWPAPVRIKVLELTFDTGLNRFLRISGEKLVLEDQIRGCQPETVSDYKLEFLNGNVPVHTEMYSGNYYRKVVHSFGPMEITSIKITILKTHGDQYARIFEVRCYEKD